MQRCAKPITFAVITAMTITFSLVFSLSQGLQAGEVAASSRKVLGVDDFMKNLDRYQGKVSFEGVVSAVNPEQQAIFLVDRQEFQARI